MRWVKIEDAKPIPNVNETWVNADRDRIAYLNLVELSDTWMIYCVGTARGMSWRYFVTEDAARRCITQILGES